MDSKSLLHDRLEGYTEAKAAVWLAVLSSLYMDLKQASCWWYIKHIILIYSVAVKENIKDYFVYLEVR